VLLYDNLGSHKRGHQNLHLISPQKSLFSLQQYMQTTTSLVYKLAQNAL
jgi:hypothetical protein